MAIVYEKQDVADAHLISYDDLRLGWMSDYETVLLWNGGLQRTTPSAPFEHAASAHQSFFSGG